MSKGGKLEERFWRTFDESDRSFSKAIELAPPRSPVAEAAYLARSRFLLAQNRLAEAGQDACRAKGIPLRDPATNPGLIDLSVYYTHTLTNAGRSGGTLDKRADAFGGLPTGVQKLGGIEYDIRGIVGRRIGFTQESTVETFPVGFNTPRLWDITSGKPVTPPMVHTGLVWKAIFSGGGREELTVSSGIGGGEEEAQVWDAAKHQDQSQ
jgi:hypothetical protein